MKKFVVYLIPLVFILLLGGAFFAFKKLKVSKDGGVATESETGKEQEIEYAGTLKIIEPNVTLSKDGQSVPLSSEEMKIEYGSEIKTDENAFAILIYEDGVTIAISSDSELTVNPKDSQNNLFQALGDIYVKVSKVLGAEESFSVETPNAVAAVRGTTFGIFVGKDKKEKLVVTKDSVDFTNKKDKVKEIVKEGLQGEFTSEQKIKIAKHVLTDKQKAWIELNKENLDDMERAKLKELFRQKIKQAAIEKIRDATPSASPASTATPAPATISVMPGAGYTSSFVATQNGTFKLSCIGSLQGATRVITDSANESDCANDCPVLPLAEYATRNGGFAAMNGMYFCPADYPACETKKNSFDTLFFNSRVKKYINSGNNVYSSIPFLVVNADGSPRFIAHAQEWGRDTGIQAGIAGNPMLILGRQNVSGNYSLDDKQRTVKSTRGAFVQASGNIYLCAVSGATVPDSARVYETLGADNAINIDGGGSTALWVNGGYKFGPGRNLPNAIIFAR